MDLKDRLKSIYSSKDNRELCERYNQWAKDYDSELKEDFGWMAPQIVTGFVTKYVPKEGRILDAGAGTGLVGQCLYREGYRNLVAMDLSEGMLEKACDKQVYGELYQMVLGESLEFPDDSFEAVVCGEWGSSYHWVTRPIPSPYFPAAKCAGRWEQLVHAPTYLVPLVGGGFFLYTLR